MVAAETENQPAEFRILWPIQLTRKNENQITKNKG